uniref:AGC-kinase C-terminal domain-containing protein n=1 Tax=Macrostomum lignano TaxID=282301 RepID=A0A1I8FVM5_9PLAT
RADPAHVISGLRKNRDDRKPTSDDAEEGFEWRFPGRAAEAQKRREASNLLSMPPLQRKLKDKAVGPSETRSQWRPCGFHKRDEPKLRPSYDFNCLSPSGLTADDRRYHFIVSR